LTPSENKKDPSPFYPAIRPYFILINHKNPSHEKLFFMPQSTPFGFGIFILLIVVGLKSQQKQAVGSLGTSRTSLIHLCFSLK